MKSFLSKITIFGSIFFTIILAPLLLPITHSTYRMWEALSASNESLFDGKFYPNFNVHKIEVGDLAHHTQYAIPKEVSWQTDAFGFRNSVFVRTPDIVFIGESNIAGSTLDQAETISSRVQAKTSLSCVNLAPYTFDEFLQALAEQVVDKPKYLIFGIIEREIPRLQGFTPKSDGVSFTKKLKRNFYVQTILTQYDRASKYNFYRNLMARLSGSQGDGIQSPIDERMFFLHGQKSVLATDDAFVSNHADRIRSYADYCDSLGIQFVFFPIPNKETLYFELAQLDHQPAYLKKLHKKLLDRNVVAINTLALFTDYKKKQKELLYHFDDAHWNGNAIELMASELATLLSSFKKS